MSTITQDMEDRQSLLNFSIRHGMSRASRKYNKSRSYIYFWLNRYDGSMESLACRSRRPLSHSNQHTPEEIKLLHDMCRRNPSLGRVELWCRFRKQGYKRSVAGMNRVLCRLHPQPRPVEKACKSKPYQKNERSTHSAKDFLHSLVKARSRKFIGTCCIQADNGFEFTNRLNSFRTQSKTAFELTAELLGIKVKHIRPYTPRHNGKVERSHREDQKRFYSRHSFYSLNDFPRQRAAWETRSNQLPMQPLGFLSPIEFLKQYTIQHV